MSGPQLYPTRMKERVHQLYYIQRNPMPKVLETLKEEFPEFSKRMTIDRMHSVARKMRLKHGLAAKSPKISKARPRSKPAAEMG